MKTLNIEQAAVFLAAHKETVRRLAVCGKIPAAKIGKRWIFLELDLVTYLRSNYPAGVTSQSADQRSNKKWRFTSGTLLGGLASPIKEKEYREALGLAIK